MKPALGLVLDLPILVMNVPLKAPIGMLHELADVLTLENVNTLQHFEACLHL